ncbi:MAG: fumarylacetoacetase [Phycisphaerales bacterium]|nr:fumarylacetoacetase [Phycisphaerales bacterium]
MPAAIDATHDPALTSWVESANDPAADFPIQNLPLCAFEVSHDGHTHNHLGVAIGDSVLDLTSFAESRQLEHLWAQHADPALIECLFMGDWSVLLSEVPAATVRLLAQSLLRADAPAGQPVRRARQKALRGIDGLAFAPPLAVGNYTDFYASVHHATTVGSMFRPDNPLLPNYKWVPIGYHGRASSVVASGTPIRRPLGQTKADDAAEPAFGPCKLLDYELELGLFVGRANALGEPVPLSHAEDHMLGVVLLNDWSARDIQKWEYQPLGPFLAKNFATTISPFLVTMEALAPFRCPAAQRPSGDPRPLPYLADDADRQRGGLDITVEVLLLTEKMRHDGLQPQRLSRGTARDLYWTFAQMLAHHTSNGCNLQVGDLLGSGTISGPTPDSRGCLLELTWDGPGKPRRPVALPTGETRTFLQDGDEVILRGSCERQGFRRIGLGDCRGVVIPAPAGPARN